MDWNKIRNENAYMDGHLAGSRFRLRERRYDRGETIEMIKKAEAEIKAEMEQRKREIMGLG